MAREIQLWKWLNKRRENSSLGQRGEDVACRYLRKKGYSILYRNFRCSLGEIDIIAMDSEDLVFIEVKARSSLHFGDPFEAVTERKQRQISKAALTYLKKNAYDGSVRFDVVSIVFDNERAEQVTLIRNAFEVAYDV